MKMTADLQLKLKPRKVKLYLPSPKCHHGIVLKQLSQEHYYILLFKIGVKWGCTVLLFEIKVYLYFRPKFKTVALSLLLPTGDGLGGEGRKASSILESF
jgi:hypothetical protein